MAGEVTAASIFEKRARLHEASREWLPAVFLNARAAESYEEDGEWDRAAECWAAVGACAGHLRETCSRRSDSREG